MKKNPIKERRTRKNIIRIGELEAWQKGHDFAIFGVLSAVLLEIIFCFVHRVDWFIAAFPKVVMSSSLETGNTRRPEQ